MQTGVRLLLQLVVQHIRAIIRLIRLPGIRPRCAVRVFLTKVHKADYIANAVGGAGAVSHPYFDLVDIGLRVDDREVLQRIIVVVAEVVAQQVVPVLFIIICLDAECLGLRPALDGYTLALAFLLGKRCRYPQLAKLQLRL